MNFMDRIIETLREIHPEHDYTASSDFIKDALLDSFDVVVLVQKLERSFGISIDGADVTPENFMNIEALKALIERYIDDSKL